MFKVYSAYTKVYVYFTYAEYTCIGILNV